MALACALGRLENAAITIIGRPQLFFEIELADGKKQ